MKKILIVHNPTAGDADYSKEALLEKVKKNKRDISYVSTKEDNWEDEILKDEDLIVLSGGDGTVRKLAYVILRKTKDRKPVPIYLVPQGTANNIATTLNIFPPRDFGFEKGEQKVQDFDYGKISGLAEHNFFLEGVGCGIFPELIRAMKAAGNFPGETSEEKLQRTLKTLKKLLSNLEPKMVELEADGSLIRGEYLMAEIQNTRFIGPRLQLAQQAEPGDGYLNLVLIKESDRDLLLKEIESMTSGTPANNIIGKFSKSLKVKKVVMASSWPFLHVDDIPIENDGDIRITAEVVKAGFKFI